ncbi:MAG: hypothetical protein JST96_05135 [Bacteroidetes bacterium]|nr:hypothetical protein [Bacteroidota bacterium]
MKWNIIKKILIGTFSVFLLLIVVLAIHIHVVTKPKVDGQTRVMARIDVHQPIDQKQANEITAWLYKQKGVDHVLCNSKTAIAIFTFSPLKADANDIAVHFKSDLNYPNATRYIPSEKELQGSCPVASTSFTYKAYSYIKHIF